MKKSSLTLKIASGLIFLAVASYLALSLISPAADPLRTTLAVSMTARESFRAEGIIARGETAVYFTGGALNLTAAEGEKIAAGGKVAEICADAASLARAKEAEALDARIAGLEAVLGSGASADRLALESGIREGTAKLVAAVRSSELAGIGESLTALEAQMLSTTGGEDELRETLARLRQRRIALGAAAPLETVTSPASGLFCSLTDGWESLAPASLEGLTAEGLAALLKETREAPSNAAGRVVSGPRWYFAALLDWADAERLEAGGYATMVFGRYLGEEIEMYVESIGLADGGKCAVVFSSNKHMADILQARKQSVELIFAEYEGIRVPKSALRLDEEGKPFVYRVSGSVARATGVELLYELEDNYIVRAAEGAQSLRSGDEIITSGRNLYDGKIVG